ncbi:MAG TPA: amidohydrolase family protein [Trebonia sp.]|jgi:aminocarboxymuconate-semialdehyde decarboxylase
MTITTPVTDVHAHLVPGALLADLAAGAVSFPHVEVRPHGNTHVVAFHGGAPTRPVSAGLTGLEERADWLASNKIDRQLVGGWLDIFGYGLPGAEAADWADVLTTAIIAEAATDDRLIPLGTVPLQDPARAADAVRKQAADGLAGIMIATRAGDTELDDPACTPFWEAVDEAGTLVYLHPGFGGASPRYQDFGLLNGLARVEDTTVTLARLLYSGIPARFPRARILVAHGGAGLPYVLGRLARNHVINKKTTADPLESFARLYFDSVVFDPAALEFLIAKAGSDRVLLGSDYPFPIADLSPRAIVESASLSDGNRSMVLGDNASALLGVRA